MNIVEFFNQSVDHERDLLIRKNHDYSGKDRHSDDPLFNLSMGEKMGIGNMEDGILWRMCDKFARIINYIKQNNGDLKVDEKITETIADFRNYLLLLDFAMKNKTNTPKKLDNTIIQNFEHRTENAKQLISELFS